MDVAVVVCSAIVVVGALAATPRVRRLRFAPTILDVLFSVSLAVMVLTFPW